VDVTKEKETKTGFQKSEANVTIHYWKQIMRSSKINHMLERPTSEIIYLSSLSAFYLFFLVPFIIIIVVGWHCSQCEDNA